MERTIEKGISEIVGALSDPIIVYPGGWGNSLPEWLRNAVILARLTENMKATKGEEPTGTDAEACAYLNTASLTIPSDSDWSQIYLYVAGKTYTRWGKGEMPADIRVESLTDQQTADLNRLKEWIYQRRLKASKERGREERTAEKVEVKQPMLFEF